MIKNECGECHAFKCGSILMIFRLYIYFVVKCLTSLECMGKSIQCISMLFSHKQNYYNANHELLWAISRTLHVLSLVYGIQKVYSSDKVSEDRNKKKHHFSSLSIHYQFELYSMIQTD